MQQLKFIQNPELQSMSFLLDHCWLASASVINTHMKLLKLMRVSSVLQFNAARVRFKPFRIKLIDREIWNCSAVLQCIAVNAFLLLKKIKIYLLFFIFALVHLKYKDSKLLFLFFSPAILQKNLFLVPQRAFHSCFLSV